MLPGKDLLSLKAKTSRNEAWVRPDPGQRGLFLLSAASTRGVYLVGAAEGESEAGVPGRGHAALPVCLLEVAHPEHGCWARSGGSASRPRFGNDETRGPATDSSCSRPRSFGLQGLRRKTLRHFPRLVQTRFQEASSKRPCLLQTGPEVFSFGHKLQRVCPEMQTVGWR